MKKVEKLADYTNRHKMSPKKDKAKNQPTILKCKFYERGYCKNGETGNKIHPEKVSEDQNLFNLNCERS